MPTCARTQPSLVAMKGKASAIKIYSRVTTLIELSIPASISSTGYTRNSNSQAPALAGAAR